MTPVVDDRIVVEVSLENEPPLVPNVGVATVYVNAVEVVTELFVQPDLTAMALIFPEVP